MLFYTFVLSSSSLLNKKPFAARVIKFYQPVLHHFWKKTSYFWSKLAALFAHCKYCMPYFATLCSQYTPIWLNLHYGSCKAWQLKMPHFIWSFCYRKQKNSKICLGLKSCFWMPNFASFYSKTALFDLMGIFFQANYDKSKG
jgi:hypothetical protein